MQSMTNDDILKLGHEMLEEELFADIDYMSPSELTTAIVKCLSYVRNTATWGNENQYDDNAEESVISASRGMPHIFFCSYLPKVIWPRFIEIIEDDLEAAEGDEDFIKAVNDLSWFMLSVLCIPKRTSGSTYFYDPISGDSRSLRSTGVMVLGNIQANEDGEKFDGRTGELISDEESIRFNLSEYDYGDETSVIMTKADHAVLETRLSDFKGAWLLLVQQDVALDSFTSPEQLLDFAYNCDDAIGDISFTSELNDANTRLLEQFLDV